MGAIEEDCTLKRVWLTLREGGLNLHNTLHRTANPPATRPISASVTLLRLGRMAGCEVSGLAIDRYLQGKGRGIQHQRKVSNINNGHMRPNRNLQGTPESR
ncbi:MAG TPA: hypothetical protein DDW52_00840 [Planctomycetaceae bacterium]|nr:hypothetical protein [Planctomycetaceae bacterium]